jgi:hypothetical protein
MEKSRFKDNGETMFDFFDCVLVVCPRCSHCASITGNPYKTNPKLVCKMCGLTGNLLIASYGDSAEYCGVSLWLKTGCCGNTLWAYNKEHLDFLESYVSASIRERVPNINQSMASRLPNWIKSSKNRESILKGILKLRQHLNQR